MVCHELLNYVFLVPTLQRGKAISENKIPRCRASFRAHWWPEGHPTGIDILVNVLTSLDRSCGQLCGAGAPEYAFPRWSAGTSHVGRARLLAPNIQAFVGQR